MMSDPGVHAAAAAAAVASKRRLRRVADTSRKRSVQSCDFCRKRRCKCVPQPTGDGCLMCHGQGVACSYTLPRKARFYGSVEDLSDRFKCLEAIVRGAFPDDSIATVPDLLRLGDRLGLPMPNLSSDATAKLSLDDLVNTGSSTSKAAVSGGTTVIAGSDRASLSAATAGVHRTSTSSLINGDDASGSGDYDVPESEQGHASTDTRPLTSNDTADSTDVVDGNPNSTTSNNQDETNETIGLIRDTTGQEHFIGSSGSLQFLGQLRRLLLLSQHDNTVSIGGPGSSSNNGRGGSSSQRLTTTFTEEDAAQALEADNGHDGETEAHTSSNLQNQHHNAPLMDERPSPMSISSALAREYVTIQPEDIDNIVSQLPPRHVLDALIRVYFKHTHPDFPLFHRGTFEEEYERFIPKTRDSTYYHPRNRTEPPIVDPGWVGCLHMILAFASLVLPTTTSTSSSSHRPRSTATPSTIASSAPNNIQDDVDLAALRKHCVSLTRFRLLPHFISRCTLANIRALLLLALYLHNHNERNAAWNIVGTATRAAFAMGLHRTVGEEHFRPVEREVRRRVFCTLFGFEQFLASSLGRPSGLSSYRGISPPGQSGDQDVETEVEIVPPRAEILDGGGYGSADDDDDGAVSTLLLRLQTILARARVSAAVKTVGLSAPPSDSNPSSSQTHTRLLRQEKCAGEIIRHLADWRSEVADCRFLNIPLITEATIQSEGGGDYFCTHLSPSDTTMDFDSLKTMLAWQSRPRLRAALVLHMQYRYVAVLSTRASLLYSMASTKGTPVKSLLPHSQQQDRQSLSEICVHNAVQLCRLVLLADAFGLINGISAMDVFYAYCAAMVLILRSLGSASREAEEDDHESRYCAELRRLIARTRQVLMRVDKCSTMKRFSRVVATFEEGSRRKDNGAVNNNNDSNGNSNNHLYAPPSFMARRDGSMASPRARNNYTSPYGRQRHTPAAPQTQMPTPASGTRRFASMSSAHDMDDHQRFQQMSPSQQLQQQQQQQQQQPRLPPVTFSSPNPSTGVYAPNHFYSGYDTHGHHNHSNGNVPFSSMPGLFAAQPNLLSLFDGEPEENQWVMDTFLGMHGGDVDDSFSGAIDWPDMDAIMRNG